MDNKSENVPDNISDNISKNIPKEKKDLNINQYNFYNILNTQARSKKSQNTYINKLLPKHIKVIRGYIL